MPRNSSGTYSKPAGTTAITGTTVDATPFNTLMDDIATALTGSLPRDGSAAMSAPLAMGGFKITGLANGAANSDAATVGQVNAVTAGVIEAGTLALFVQTAAPTGWTKQTTHNNKALRLVSGSASSGGSTAFTSVFTSRTISTANLPSHSHSAGSLSFSDSVSFNRTEWIYDTSESKTGYNGSGGSSGVQDTDDDRDNISGSVSGTCSGTSGSTGSGTAMDFAVQYVDVIIASKN